MTSLWCSMLSRNWRKRIIYRRKKILSILNYRPVIYPSQTCYPCLTKFCSLTHPHTPCGIHPLSPWPFHEMGSSTFVDPSTGWPAPPHVSHIAAILLSPPSCCPCPAMQSSSFPASLSSICRTLRDLSARPRCIPTCSPTCSFTYLPDFLLLHLQRVVRFAVYFKANLRRGEAESPGIHTRRLHTLSQVIEPP